MKASAWSLGMLAWLAGSVFAADNSVVEKGQLVYQKWCMPCHGAGPGKPGTAAGAAHYKGSKPAVLEERTDLTVPTIKELVRHGVYLMPRFRKTEISDAELDAIAAYLTRQQRP